MSNKIIVVGAGASGIFASIIASMNGLDVILLEKNNKIGRKLLATGNGRCNYTNIYADIDNYHGLNNKFAYSALSTCNPYMTIGILEDMGITPKIEENGKVFPASLQSSSVIEIFQQEIDRKKINLYLETEVKDIQVGKGYKVITNKGEAFTASKLIIATGGRSLPKSGSDGSGYHLAEKLGHRITDIFPGIVQLHLDDKYLREKSGVRIFGRAELIIDGKFVVADTDDILFTDYGISGPSILQLSRRAVAALRESREVKIKVVTILDKDQEDLHKYLLERFQKLGDKTVYQALIGLINTKLIGSILREVKIKEDSLSSELTKEDIFNLSSILKAWYFTVIDHQPWEFAQVTAGGIDTKDISSKTMESKLYPGLYFIGEILDIDGDCGGYNLQWAWSSAYVAGISAASD